jgi:murein DD-endopeptidase MepM/ murein hydrolase activator NlpD
MSGYGYTVIVYHGGGLATLYAHMSAFSVETDQYIAQGGRLGSVGMTGTATGPHLHFEVRSNGVPQNPCGYISC